MRVSALYSVYRSSVRPHLVLGPYYEAFVRHFTVAASRLPFENEWKIVAKDSSMMVIRNGKTKLYCDIHGGQSFIRECPHWEEWYLPSSLSGKKVLDVGARWGDTAAFFMKHGASKVIMIEADKTMEKIHSDQHKKQ